MLSYLERETQSRHAQPLVLEGSTQQAAFIVAAVAPMTTYMPSCRHTTAAAARNPLAAFSISRLKGPKSLSAVVLERLSSANSLFSCRQRPCLHPLPPLPKPLAAPPPLAAFSSVSAVSKTQRGCLAQPRIPSESSLEIYFLEFL